MLNTQKILTSTMRNDFKELSNLMKKAIGYNTIPEFANKCGIPNSARYLADIVHGKVSVFPDYGFIEKIANGSDFRVSLDELKAVCGYTDENKIDLRSIKVLRGWICWCDFGNVLDSEQGGKRPSLVIQNNLGNKHAGITTVIPISSKIAKNKMPTHIRIGQNAGLAMESELLVEQMRVVSKRRLLIDGTIQILSKCPEDILRQVEIAIMKQTGITDVNTPESVVDRFLSKMDEYAAKLEHSYNGNYNSGRNLQPAYA